MNVLTARTCKGETLEITGGGQRRPFLRVKDAAVAFASVLISDVSLVLNNVFNLGVDANNLRIFDLADLVYSAIPSAHVNYLSEVVDQRDYGMDFSKIARTLGFEAKFSAAEGIAEIQQKLSMANGINIADPVYSNEKRMRQLLSETWNNGRHAPSIELRVGSAA